MDYLCAVLDLQRTGLDYKERWQRVCNWAAYLACTLSSSSSVPAILNGRCPYPTGPDPSTQPHPASTPTTSTGAAYERGSKDKQLFWLLLQVPPHGQQLPGRWYARGGG